MAMRLADRLLHKVIFPHGLKRKAAAQGQQAAGEAFRITGTRYLPDGFVVEGYARVAGVPVPAKAAVTMRSLASSQGEWAIRPERVTVGGVPVNGALGTVRQTMAADPRLRAEGDRFVVLLGDAQPRPTALARLKAAFGALGRGAVPLR
ncbi:MAG: hypothetical protein VKQ33_00225 [Candidatus Sericytochromatia bacterium]|nr:hypothetical protein [Candidatus Sericytochromatia bacterium]